MKPDETRILERLGQLATATHTTLETAQDIKLAARALYFIYQNELTDQFTKFVEDLDRPLTEEQKAHLKSMGLES